VCRYVEVFLAGVGDVCVVDRVVVVVGGRCGYC
jgi:hypothetical protein